MGATVKNYTERAMVMESLNRFSQMTQLEIGILVGDID